MNPNSSSDPAGLRSTSVRQRNLATIARLIHLEGPTSRSDLAHQTGLTRTSIATLVGDLVGLGYVHELAPDPAGKRGRPSPVVHPSAPTNLVVGVDVRLDEIHATAVGVGGTALHTERAARPATSTPDNDAALIRELVQQISDTLDAEFRLLGLGLSVPGLVERASERVATAPNLGWRNLDFASIVSDQVGCPTVTIGNEADLGALAESRRGTMRGRPNLLYVSGNVGIGGGIIADGTRLEGAHGFAGEVGHMPVNLDGDRCACGSVGCFETEIGAPALLRRAGIDGSGTAAIASLFDRLDANDPATAAALAEHVRWLSFGLSAALRLLDADTIVLGGLLGRLLDHMQPNLDQALAERALIPDANVTVIGASLGQDAPSLGAAEATWDRILADPERAITQAAVDRRETARR